MRSGKFLLQAAVLALGAGTLFLSLPARAEDPASPAQAKVEEKAVPSDAVPAAKAKDEANVVTVDPGALPEHASVVAPGFDPLKYTLGPEDVVEISVMRHPEFSGVYPINQEGKLQYKFVGDMQVTGLTKSQLEDKIREIISKFVISPEVNVTITDYKSKVFFVLGEVGGPGKYYMRSETISVRDAVVMAGLPTQAAAMRKAQIITPGQYGGKIQYVNLYELLYGGDLKRNVNLYPGDFLYVPSTVMAKVFRVISPASSAVATAVSPVNSLSSGKTDSQNLNGRQPQ